VFPHRSPAKIAGYFICTLHKLTGCALMWEVGIQTQAPQSGDRKREAVVETLHVISWMPALLMSSG